MDKDSKLRSDMEYHDHVTSHWPRCSSVELQGEYLVCVLDSERRYDLADNRAQRHVRFLNLKTDEDLVGFVRAWGPLWLGGSDQEPNGKIPRSWCWAFQAKLIAEVGLVQSFKSRDKAALKDALSKYVAAKDGWRDAKVPRTTAFTESVYSRLITSDDGVQSEEWIPKAGLSALREAAAKCVSTFGLDFTLRAMWTDGKPQLEWKPRIQTLADAIQWQLWNSFTGARPLTICEECQRAFLPDDAHARKFCSHKCGHRVAMRMWRKNNAKGQPKRKWGKHAKTKKA
jgi:hypothetical protein